MAAESSDASRRVPDGGADGGAGGQVDQMSDQQPSAQMAGSATHSATGSGVRHVEVDESAAGQRIDNFLLKTAKGVPRSLVYRWLRKGEVRVNKKRAKPTVKLMLGDSVRIPPVRIVAAEHADYQSSLPPRKLVNELLANIVYEDDSVLLLNKPSGVAAHGGTGIPFGVIEAMRTTRDGALELVHRLDRETSGLLLLAKSRSSLLALQQQLQADEDSERMEKRYLTLVCGRWSGPKDVTVGLTRGRSEEDAESLTLVDDDGKVALSEFKPLAFYSGFTSMDVKITTGRMHQIRVHAAHTGHPLAGDRKYGDKEMNKRLRKMGLKRLFLHAHWLGFVHPASGARVEFHAELPDDLRQVLDVLDARDVT